MEAHARLTATVTHAFVHKCTRDKIVRFIQMLVTTDHARTVVPVQPPTPEPATFVRVERVIQVPTVEHLTSAVRILV